MTPIRTLHLLNKPPEHSRYRLCLAAIGPGDALLLFENGVLAVTQTNEMTPDCMYALKPDLQARALTDRISEDRVVSFDQMVELTAAAQRVISW